MRGGHAGCCLEQVAEQELQFTGGDVTAERAVVEAALQQRLEQGPDLENMYAPAGLSLLVTSWSGQKERSHALGIYGAIASAGFASGAVLGGLLVEVTWRLVFFVNVPVGVALLVASFRLLPPDPPSSRGQLDVPGAILVTAGVSLLVFAVARAGDTLRVTQPALIAAAAIVLLGRVRRPGKGRPGPRFSTWPCSRTAASWESTWR